MWGKFKELFINKLEIGRELNLHADSTRLSELT